MGKMSRDKGKRFERTVAHMFRDEGYEARRSAQYCGKTGDAADVVGPPGIHIECKHVETSKKIYDWMDQAVRDSGKSGNKPVVIHHRNNCDTLVTMRFEDWIEIYREWEAGEFLCATREKDTSKSTET